MTEGQTLHLIPGYIFNFSTTLTAKMMVALHIGIIAADALFE
jgi:hypothetical protein